MEMCVTMARSLKTPVQRAGPTAGSDGSAVCRGHGVAATDPLRISTQNSKMQYSLGNP